MLEQAVGELTPPTRILLGPGPSNVHPRILQALTAPILGYLDADFLKVMDETVALLRPTFQTRNALTLPVSGTGFSGMEATLCSLLEEGDKLLVGINGFFGQRLAEVARRAGAHVVMVETEWGRTVDPAQVEASLRAHPDVKVVALVHAETSTGILQPLEEASRLAKEYGALFLVDTVTSLGGCRVAVDEWGVDAAYNGAQKCVGGLPGMAPVTLNERAVEKIRARKRVVQSWYLDVVELGRYWITERVYHHTAPINLVYALREALRLVHEEGLERRWARHEQQGNALKAGLAAMGLELFGDERHRLPQLTCVRVPEGIDDLRVRRALISDFNIEVGGGLGALKGKVWRIGLMGYSATRANVLLMLSALEQILRAEGLPLTPGSGLAAAAEAYGSR